MAIADVKVRIEGTTPLLMNRFTEEAQAAATSGNRISTPGDKGTPQEQATKKLYTNGDDEIIMPQPNIFACIIEAGKFFKVGKSKVTTQKTSLIPAALEMDGLYYLVAHKEGWNVDTRPVRIPSTGGRILCHRPCFEDWAIDFSLSVDTDIISEKLMRDIVDVAGKRIGLGDFRPACKGPFGKFVVTLWENGGGKTKGTRSA